MAAKKKVQIVRSSGNVFEDLGFGREEAEHLKIRSALMAAIVKLIKVRKLTQSSAAVLFGVSQPRISDLVRGKIDLFFLCDLSFARSRKSELHTLREVTLVDAPAALRTDLSLLQRASYAAALITQTTETDTPVPDLFELLHAFLESVVPASTGPVSVLAFELKLLHALGLAPPLEDIKLTSGCKRLVQHLTDTDWLALGQLKLSTAQFTELNRFLHGFLIYHLGKIPSSRQNALGP